MTPHAIKEQDCPESQGLAVSIDPFARTGRPVLLIPEVESLIDMCEVSSDVYVMGGGTYRVETYEGPLLGSFGVWLVDLTTDEPKLDPVPRIPEIRQLSDLATCDGQTVIAVDTYHGKVYRINLRDKTSSVCIE
ncbi:putative Cytochrome p450 [Seiridium unicorne]|uniref:Cytochrome p450 n=1 Tax=Seiridium unicorne TaxID=138068 RepID=A0ABR2UF27_9PEZI